MQHLILSCIVNLHGLSIIWNGQRVPSFSRSKGFHQGDPLSPYLFVICMDAILQVADRNDWKLVTISTDGLGLCHLFFADDVLLFTKASAS